MATYSPHAETKVVKLTLRGVVDRPGMAAGIFSTLGERGINVDLITASAIGAGKSDVSFVVGLPDFERVMSQMEELKKEFQAEEILHDLNVAIVALQVAELVQTPGTAARMFAALSGSGVNIEMISTSMASITCVIPESCVDDALNALDAEFGEAEFP